ncbi:hypothetical protein NEOLEDRAFT_841964 [Neolentinus lepideus HHB14362 ss-1]|uniref:Uncharacterized protein n=1 Tax=Neolentinus lepideus HHB14362 ss-1 TaxID=1314782 RepID=A0A165P4Q0_9AGAM|nr:hypothetical protein NEOLEDRAFT_841964 [Neolentinus lepideus HHB14362 ss-1]
MFEELNSTSFRLLGRFMHEWNAQKADVGTDARMDFENYVLAFPTAVGLSELRELSSRLVDIDILSSRVSDVVAITTQKDRDTCDMILEVLRERLLLASEDNKERLRNRFDVLSFLFDFKSIVKVPLHSDSWVCLADATVWRFPDQNQTNSEHRRRYLPYLGWGCPYNGLERLIGDMHSLRLVPSEELPKRLKYYVPIVGSLDDSAEYSFSWSARTSRYGTVTSRNGYIVHPNLGMPHCIYWLRGCCLRRKEWKVVQHLTYTGRLLNGITVYALIHPVIVTLHFGRTLVLARNTIQAATGASMFQKLYLM